MPIAAADMARRPHTFGRPNAVIAGTEELPRNEEPACRELQHVNVGGGFNRPPTPTG